MNRTRILFFLTFFAFVMPDITFAIGSISGTVYYRGTKDGDIYVGAYDHAPPFQTPPTYFTTINDTGPYTISGVADGTYWLAAFMDTDSNHTYDFGIDPYGYDPLSHQVQGDSLTGIDILLDYVGSFNNVNFYPIKLSSSIQAAWPGTEDYLCYYKTYADHPWGPEYIDSVWTGSPSIDGWGGRMYDDGLHWDDGVGDSIFGHYEVNDSAAMHIWSFEVLFWDLWAEVIYTPWPFYMVISNVWSAYENPIATPLLILPGNDDTTNLLQPDFLWHANGADWYEVIVWDTVPSPTNIGENIIWREATASGGNDTTLSMSGATAQLEHGKSYCWALIAYGLITIPQYASAMEWAQFVVDTTYQGIEEHTALFDQSIEVFKSFPNPFRDRTVIEYALSSMHYAEDNGVPTIRIYDVSGRLVKDFPLATCYSLLPTRISWNGTDDHGKRVAAGVYFGRLQGVNGSKTIHLIFLP